MADAKTTEVGVGYVRLVPSMEGFGPAATKGMGTELAGPMSKAGSEAGQSFTTGLGSFLQGTGKRMSDLGTKMTLGLTTPLVAFGLKAVSLASDLNESLSKSNTVFGKAAGVVEQFAADAANSLGLSKKAALDAAGGFGNMFTQLGFGADATANMSTKMLSLAADFSSFHNVDISQVLEAQSAAFRGEYDSVQRFLPLMNAAAVENEALAETHKKSAKQLTAAEKAQAAYNLMLRDAGPAAGDFARTADQDANATRRAKAEAENAAAAFGTKLLPIKMKLVTIVGQLLDRFNRLSPSMQRIVMIGAMIVAAIGPIMAVVGPILSVIGLLIGANPIVLAIIAGFVALAAVGILVKRHWTTVHHWLMVAWGAMQRFGRWVQGAWGSVAGALGGPLVATGHFFVGLYRTALRVFSWLANTFGPGLARIWAPIAANAGPVFREIGQTISSFKARWDAAWPGIVATGRVLAAIFRWIAGVAVDAWNQMWPVVSFAIGIITSTVRAGLGVLAAIWRATWSLVGDTFMALWRFVTRMLGDALSIIANTIRFFLNILQGDWGAAWGNVRDIARAFWDEIGAVFRLGWEILKAVWTAGWGFVSDLFWVMYHFVADRVGDIVSVVVGIWSRVSGAAGALKDGLTAVFTAVKDWASDRVTDVVSFFSGLPKRVGDAISSITEKITSPFTSAFSTIQSKWNSTVGGFGFSFSLPDWLGGKSFSLKIPRMHTGGIFDPVGGGTEGLAMLKKGEGVFTQAQMRAIGTSRSAPAADTRAVVELHAGGLDRALLEWLRGTVRTKGGNVQMVLGAGGR